MRRVLAALLCICLLLPLLSASSPSYAVDSYLITIAEDTVLEQVGTARWRCISTASSISPIPPSAR